MCPVKLEYRVSGAGRTYGWMSGDQVTKLLWTQELKRSVDFILQDDFKESAMTTYVFGMSLNPYYRANFIDLCFSVFFPED